MIVVTAAVLITVATLSTQQTNASHYELINGDLHRVRDDDNISSSSMKTKSGNTKNYYHGVSPFVDANTRQKDVWEFISTFDSYKTSASYKVVDGKPTLENFKYLVQPIWWSDMDASDPTYQMDPTSISPSWLESKQYYIDMSWGKMPNGVTYELLEQEQSDISSVEPTFDETSDYAFASVESKGYVKDVDYNGVCLMYFTSQSGVFSGEGGWADINEDNMLWLSYPPYPESFYVLRHEIGHNFGHHHHLSISYAYRDTRPDEGEGSAPYDGFDMMSGGNDVDISHIAAASKWFWNWIPDSSIILMQPEGSTTECPSCASSGIFTLSPFDDKDLPPTSSRKMGIHIPVAKVDNTLYSYWLSYRSGNDGLAQNGLSVHLTWFELGGYFGATYDSMNFDAFGDTDTTLDSFVIEDSCYHIAPPSYLKDRAFIESELVQPVVCVNSINPGTSITVTVTFQDKENPPSSQVSIGQNIELKCGSSMTSTGLVTLDASKYNLIHVKGAGYGGEVVLEMCTTKGTTSAFFYDEYPHSAISYGSEAAYGSYKSLTTSEKCSSTDSFTYKSDYGETYIAFPPVDGGSTIQATVSCSLAICLPNQYLSNDECVQCPPNSISAFGSISSSACVPCPEGTELQYPTSQVCAQTNTYEKIESATKWRLWAPYFDTSDGWGLDIPEIELYESIDCTGSSIDTSTASAIDSGNAGDGWGASNAFDGNMWSVWGGRFDSNSIFYIGIDFGNTLQTVHCVKYYRGDSDKFLLNVRVQAYVDGQWKNAWIEKNLEKDKAFNIISLVSPTSSPTASPTSSPTASPTVSPTSSPTASPTSSPTASPTIRPSVSVSPTSSASPTSSPSVSMSPSISSSPTVSSTDKLAIGVLPKILTWLACSWVLLVSTN